MPLGSAFAQQKDFNIPNSDFSGNYESDKTIEVPASNAEVNVNTSVSSSTTPSPDPKTTNSNNSEQTLATRKVQVPGCSCKELPSALISCEQTRLYELQNQRHTNSLNIATAGMAKGEVKFTTQDEKNKWLLFEIPRQERCVKKAKELVKAESKHVYEKTAGTSLSGSADMASNDGPKKDCGNYGGLNCESTRNMNTAILKSQEILNNVGAAVVSVDAANQAGKLTSKGSGATAQDAEDTRKSIARTAMRKSGWMAVGVAGMAAVQGGRARAHELSARDIELKAAQYTVAEDQAIQVLSDANKELNNQIANLQSKDNKTELDKQDIAKLESILAANNNQIAIHQQRIKNIENNSQSEIAAQRGAKAESYASMGTSLIIAAHHGFEAKRLDIVAKSSQINGSGEAPKFAVVQNSSGQVVDNPDNQGSSPDTEQAALTNTDVGPGDEKFDDSIKNFNPDFNDPRLASLPPVGEGGSVNPPSAPSGGSAASGAGGTSAAQDSGQGGPEAPGGKTQAGKYESGEGGGSRFSRGGGSAIGSGKVGLDGGFADLLKKFLPGAEDERAPAEANALADAGDDRTPASDRASVISREKNIFKEVSKRYLKKNSDGSVLFQ